MYLDSEKVSFMRMFDSQLLPSTGEECSSTPTSEFSASYSQIVKKHDTEQRKDLESYSPCSSSSSSVKELKAAEETKMKGEAEDETATTKEDDNEDDGYHTPTSPRHRISSPLQCPPAPKKPILCTKRKAERGQIRRQIKFFDKDIQAVLCEKSNNPKRRNKKAKTDATIVG